MDFVTEENIRRFLKLLETETDPGRRQTLEVLLREERQKTGPSGPPV